MLEKYAGIRELYATFDVYVKIFTTDALNIIRNNG